MVRKDLVAMKLAELAGRVDRIRTHRRATADELSADRDALELVAFNLMLAVQCCADVASHLIADEGWPAAGSLSDSFQRLGDRGVLSAPIALALGRAVGLRNVVAHGYAGVDVAAVHVAAAQGVLDLEAFAREVAVWVAKR